MSCPFEDCRMPKTFIMVYRIFVDFREFRRLTENKRRNRKATVIVRHFYSNEPIKNKAGENTGKPATMGL